MEAPRQLRIAEVRSATLFLSAQAQFRSQQTCGLKRTSTAIFLVRKVTELRIAEQVADLPTFNIYSVLVYGTVHISHDVGYISITLFILNITNKHFIS